MVLLYQQRLFSFLTSWRIYRSKWIKYLIFIIYFYTTLQYPLTDNNYIYFLYALTRLHHNIYLSFYTEFAIMNLSYLLFLRYLFKDLLIRLLPFKPLVNFLVKEVLTFRFLINPIPYLFSVMNVCDKPNIRRLRDTIIYSNIHVKR